MATIFHAIPLVEIFIILMIFFLGSIVLQVFMHKGVPDKTG